jgi:LPXTG-site transpeptidase (sortase) family protein
MRENTALRAFLHLLSTLFMVAGMILIGLVGAFYGYAVWAQSQLYTLNRGIVEAREPDFSGTPTAPMELPLDTIDQGTTTAIQFQPEVTPESAITPTPEPTPDSEPEPEATVEELPSPFWIVIPSLDVDSKVVEVQTEVRDGEIIWRTASHAVGHHKGTADPGEKGNMVLTGHIRNLTEGMVFNRLPEIQPGDEVYVFSESGRFVYQVVRTQVVLPTQTNVMDSTPDATATLITCVPDWVYSHRLIVTTKLVATPEPKPAVNPFWWR